MKVLVFGASGLLGGNVVASVRKRGAEVLGTYHTTKPDLDVDHRQCDITNSEDVGTVVRDFLPDVVVNCAAMTDVDECEGKPDEARAVNGVAPGQVAQICSQQDCRFVHISTDYVFDGVQNEPYKFDDDTNPIQQYGYSKRLGEKFVMSNAASALVVRLSFVYGNNRSSGTLEGFPAWVANELQAGNEIPLYTDQYITPSRAGQASETLLELIDAEASGIFHASCRKCVTPHEFGTRIARRLGGEGTVVEGVRSDVDRVARRPRFTCLDVSQTEQTLGRPQPTLATDLDRLNFDQI